jgi:hypothetical protein
MKKGKNILCFVLLFIFGSTVSSCSMYNSVFGPKYGCPSNGRNVGAERILSGEKLPPAPKFKA